MVILKAEKENATEIYARSTYDEYAYVQGMRLMIHDGDNDNYIEFDPDMTAMIFEELERASKNGELFVPKYL